MPESAQTKSGDSDRIAVWGGVECTVNRVGNIYFDQLERGGHAARFTDLERCASLGISALRYPVIWERTAPRSLVDIDWHWSDARLLELRALGITPIVGLVHHGSGPAYTSLVDPAFPEKLAEYAGAVAARYPWIENYTPINEPLTTARFSGLYGVWYPHGREPRTFIDALLNQCRAVALAMNAIRAVNSRAKLIQTEDLGKTYSTPLLAYQAEFNNHLRWLTWDLLCGKLDRAHPLWDWLVHCAGAGEAELLWFQENRCPPQILGANHYVTSQRFLDEQLINYPACYHGGHGRQRYADIEAARCLTEWPDDLQKLLAEAWERYRLPLAVTECHIDSTRDDQLRWLAQVWRATEAAKHSGVDVRAFTLWALFGAYDWNSLVTRQTGYYEPGAFDVRGPEPRPTAIAVVARQLASGAAPAHPVLATSGWWLRHGRFFCPPVEPHQVVPSCAASSAPVMAGLETETEDAQPTALALISTEMGSFAMPAAPLLITGATGTLGNAFGRLCTARGVGFRLLSRAEMDLGDSATIERALTLHEPWGVINAAGYVRVDDAEHDVERCFRENTVGAHNLASACSRHNLPLVTFSSDLVFDGQQDRPYLENDQVAPLNAYGKSKAEGEKRVLDSYPEALVIRTSAFFGPWDAYNYVALVLRSLRRRQSFMAAGDTTISPTYVPDLVHATLDLLIDDANGIWHLTNSDAVTWAELALRAARTAGLDESLVQICRSDDLNYVARRPKYSALGSQRASLMPTLDDAINRLLSGPTAD
jgi:dTDP-4-dehydrorhamnose reductase